LQTKLEIIKHVQRNYHDLGPIKKITKLRHTDINTTIFLIDSSSGKYILRKFKTPNPQKMEKICEILYHCIKNNVKVMEPIRNNNKKFVDKDNLLFLTKFYEGKHFSGKRNELISLAKHIAILHKFLKICPISLHDKEKLDSYKIIQEEDLKKIEKSIMKKKPKDSHDLLVLSNMKFLLTITNQYNKNKNILKNILPKQLIHFDLHPKNLVFYKDNVSAILDFGTLQVGSVIDDVAFCSFRFSSEKNSITKN